MYRYKRQKQLFRRVALNIPELKYKKTVLLNGTIPNTWTFYDPLGPITQGTAQGTRIGNQIFLDSLDVYVQLKADTITNVDVRGTICRVIVYHQREAQGGLPSATEIFDQNAYDAMRTLDYFPKRATILWDKLHTMTPLIAATTTGTTTTTTSAGPKFWTQFKIPVKKIIQYTGNGGTIADIAQDAYGVGVCADAAGCCAAVVTVRARYRDA